jgi:hypothetical protein
VESLICASHNIDGWWVSSIGESLSLLKNSRFVSGYRFSDTISRSKSDPSRGWESEFESINLLPYFGITARFSLGIASSVALSIPRWASTSSDGVWVSHSESERS